MSRGELIALALGTLAAITALHWLAWRAWSLLRSTAPALAVPMRGAGQWARRHPLRTVLQARWPRVYTAMAGRLDPRRFAGLPLTLLAIAALYTGSLFGGLIEELMLSKGVVQLDSHVNEFFVAYRSQPLLDLFIWLTALGSSPTVVAVAATASLSLWVHRGASALLALWITLLGAQTTTWAGKYLIGRPRPAFIDGVTAVAPAFPSGHATAAMAVYGFVAYALAREAPGPRARFELVFWTAVVIALIGFSRIFLSVHHTSDVLGGYLVGAFWLLVGVALAELGQERERKTRA